MSLRRTLLVGLLALAALAIALFVWPRFAGQSRGAVPKAPPPVPITAAPVVVKALPVRLTAVGNVEPYTSVSVKARVDGQIVAVRFKEGDSVHKGDVLFEIDPRTFKATLAQAEANLAKDQASLDRARAQDIRYQDLLRQNFISKDAYEQVRTNVETSLATVNADKAAADNARLSLEYCTIRSPLDGYAGRILIQEGNLIKANDASPLVTINQIVPVYASFAVPEQNLAAVRERQASGDLVVQAALPSGTHGPSTGRLSFIDNAADMTTGTIRLKAEFANKDVALWPGQFVNVTMTLYQQNDALVAPSRAIQNGPGGQYVFVVKRDGTVELRDVKVDRAIGEDTVVADGLRAGEVVVTGGQLRLAPGSRVTLQSDKPA
jgi:multidrug efflux system membrane fusion protein